MGSHDCCKYAGCCTDSSTRWTRDAYVLLSLGHELTTCFLVLAGVVGVADSFGLFPLLD